MFVCVQLELNVNFSNIKISPTFSQPVHHQPNRKSQILEEAVTLMRMKTKEWFLLYRRIIPPTLKKSVTKNQTRALDPDEYYIERDIFKFSKNHMKGLDIGHNRFVQVKCFKGN